MSDAFDAVVIGMGPGGEVAADRLISAGKRVAVVERELIGGECGYWACIPSKVLLRPVEARGGAARAAGVSEPALDWADAARYRDTMVRHYDDAAQVKGYEERGATVLKGAARLTGPGRVEIDGRELEAEHVVIATGSESVVPPIDGLGDIDYWTNREATALEAIPASAVVIGGGPVAIELGQFMARFGTAVTLVQHGDHLIGREEPRASELIRAALEDDGIDVRTGRSAKRVRRDGEGIAVTLDDGSELDGDVLVVATGRRPRVADLGLASVGIEPTERGGLPVDDHCRLADGLWAVGDATGVMLFTHLAKYQARIVADNILGKSRAADYRAIPRVVFTDPEVSAVGLTAEQARKEGIDVVTSEIDLAATLARPSTYEEHPRGWLGLVADRSKGELVGAWGVCPLSSEWIHVASTAIRARIPVETLVDSVAQFPSYSEGYLAALEALEL